jgi:para-nitrobenzyl esterase
MSCVLKGSLRAAAALALILSNTASGDEAPHAKVSTGELAGVRQAGVSAFLGIPFAAPPVGNLRWRAPKAPLAWKGVRAADHFGASCLQEVTPAGFGPWKHEYVVQGDVGEDCLFLNVWTPAPAAGHLPVLVWIHGGAFTSGSGSVPIYNGTALASQGVVVVTINYRVGIWGFLAHPDLTREAAGAAPSNFGLQDMVAALRWVQANISAFGGDPKRVTIAGQSAGSIAVHDLLVSPLAKGLFAQAISESGLPTTIPARSLGEAQAAGEAFVHFVGANDIAALRVMSAAKIQAGAPKFGISPVVDGVLLPDDPMEMIAAGHFNAVPVLIGLNADEGSMDSGYGPKEAAELRASGLAAVYFWARAYRARSHEPIYAYFNTYVEPGPESVRYGAFHSSEIPYVFGTLNAAPERGFTAADTAHSRQMSAYWVSFIAHGDPNGDHRPQWPKFDAAQPEVMQLDAVSKAIPLLTPEKLKAQEEIIENGGTPRMF